MVKPAEADLETLQNCFLCLMACGVLQGEKDERLGESSGSVVVENVSYRFDHVVATIVGPVCARIAAHVAIGVVCRIGAV